METVYGPQTVILASAALILATEIVGWFGQRISLDLPSSLFNVYNTTFP